MIQVSSAAPETLGQVLKNIQQEIHASNLDAKREQESRLEELLRDYLWRDKDRFAFGGVTNLLGMIGTLLAERSQLEGDEWEQAAEAVDECAAACDLRYSK